MDLWAKTFRDVAQPGSALGWGSRGRKFESCRPDIFATGVQRAVAWGRPAELRGRTDITGQAGKISTCPVFIFAQFCIPAKWILSFWGCQKFPVVVHKVIKS